MPWDGSCRALLSSPSSSSSASRTLADARAANELCGQTVTTNVTFTADQSCGGDGRIVGADGITIDLGGFTLKRDCGGDAAHDNVDEMQCSPPLVCN